MKILDQRLINYQSLEKYFQYTPYPTAKFGRASFRPDCISIHLRVSQNPESVRELHESGPSFKIIVALLQELKTAGV